MWTLKELADRLGLVCKGDPTTEIKGLATLASARSGQLAFLANPKYRSQLENTQAAAVILSPDHAADYPGDCLISDDPYLSFAKATALFDQTPKSAVGVHPSAVVEEGVHLGEGVSIGPNAVIASGAAIGAGSLIGAGVSIGANAVLGENCRLHANVSIYHDVAIGNRVVIHSGAVLGSDGFGFAPSPDGWVKIHQLGGVRIGNDVEIGAGTTIDRGALDDTVIGEGVILDNQVQIAHNVRIGDGTAIAGCSAVAGSTTIGKRCTIAGAVGIVGHLDIVDDVHITAMTLVTRSISEKGSYSAGTPMSETRSWRRSAARFNQLDELTRRVQNLEKKQ